MKGDETKKLAAGSGQKGTTTTGRRQTAIGRRQTAVGRWDGRRHREQPAGCLGKYDLGRLHRSYGDGRRQSADGRRHRGRHAGCLGRERPSGVVAAVDEPSSSRPRRASALPGPRRPQRRSSRASMTWANWTGHTGTAEGDDDAFVPVAPRGRRHLGEEDRRSSGCCLFPVASRWSLLPVPAVLILPHLQFLALLQQASVSCRGARSG